MQMTGRGERKLNGCEEKGKEIGMKHRGTKLKEIIRRRRY